MSNEMIELLIKSFWETGYMVVASTVLASLIGIPLGIILTVTRNGTFCRMPLLTPCWALSLTPPVPLRLLF